MKLKYFGCEDEMACYEKQQLVAKQEVQKVPTTVIL